MIVAVLFACVLLLAGVLLRLSLPPLRWIFIPASIVGGLLGLLVIQLDARLTDGLLGPVTDELKSWPGWLIAVVFACMLLGRKSNNLKQGANRIAREGIVVWIIVLGQTAVGLLCTWLLIQPFVDVPNSFGMLIETGFAGGHGTAAAMGTVFESNAIQLEGGLDLGLFMATVGLLLSVTSGVFYVNLAIRRGWTNQSARESSPSKTSDASESKWKREIEEPPGPTIARGVVRSEVIDPLVFQLLIVGLAFGIGWCAKQGVTQLSLRLQAPPAEATSAGDTAPKDTLTPEQVLKQKTSLVGTLGDFPLFIYTLFGGMLVRRGFEWIGKPHMIDSLSIERISNIAMEFLIVAAIASLRIEAVTSLAVPLLILLSGAFLWTGFCLLFVARKLLPSGYWFELGILNYGMSTGTTATGFTLLKMIDPKLDSGAAEDYALAAPMSAPFVGGGMVTVGLPMFVLERIPIAASALLLVASVVALYTLALFLKRRAGHTPVKQN